MDHGDGMAMSAHVRMMSWSMIYNQFGFAHHREFNWLCSCGAIGPGGFETGGLAELDHDFHLYDCEGIDG